MLSLAARALVRSAASIAVRLGSPCGSGSTLNRYDFARMAHDERVLRELAEEVERVKARLARIEQVKRFAVAERDLSQDDGELTPTLKVKRAIVFYS